MKKPAFSLIGVLLIIIIVGVLDSPKTDDNSGMVQMQNLSDMQEVTVQNEDDAPTTYSYLEYILEEEKEIDGYIVENYREYEIYTDEKGDIIKKVPTSNYNSVRYQKDNE